MTDEKRSANQPLAVIREVYEGGRGVIGERWSLKKTGDAAAHGEEVGESRALSALRALRRFVAEMQW